jgi:hypothetical protein
MSRPRCLESWILNDEANVSKKSAQETRPWDEWYWQLILYQQDEPDTRTAGSQTDDWDTEKFNQNFETAYAAQTRKEREKSAINLS